MAAAAEAFPRFLLPFGWFSSFKKGRGAILPEGDGGSRVEAGRCKEGTAPVGKEWQGR